MCSGSRPRRQTPPPEQSCSMWRPIFTLLPIALALILLPVIAFASPPDPSWIAGIYDGADGDDIVTLVYETAGVEDALTGPVPPLPRSSEISIVSSPSTIHGLPACQFTRAPPAPPALIFMVPAQVSNSLPDSPPTASLSDTRYPRPAAQGG